MSAAQTLSLGDHRRLRITLRRDATALIRLDRGDGCVETVLPARDTGEAVEAACTWATALMGQEEMR